MSRKEVTIEIADESRTRYLIGKDPREFVVWVRDALTSRSPDSCDSARRHLREEYGVVVTATRTIFEEAS